MSLRINLLQKACSLIAFSIILSCSEQKTQKEPESGNQELIELVQKDQKMRSGDMSETDAGQDFEHRKRVLELLAQGKITTPKDKLNAALILQHTNLGYCEDRLISESVDNYLLGSMLSKDAYENGLEDAKTMYAANLDRFLWLTQGIQKYGTQKVYVEEADDFYWVPIDTITTDEERMHYGISPLKELLQQTPMNPYPQN